MLAFACVKDSQFWTRAIFKKSKSGKNSLNLVALLLSYFYFRNFLPQRRRLRAKHLQSGRHI
jgi:hypothetical protein